MKDLSVRAELVEQIATLTGIDVGGKSLQGNDLGAVASALNQWARDPAFTVDCGLMGLRSEDTNATIAAICAASANGETIVL